MAANHIANVNGGKDWTLASSVSSLWDQGLIQGFTAVINGQEFQVNKAVFASVSNRFHRALIKTGANDKLHMVMEGVKGDALEILIPFIHTSKMNVTLTKKIVLDVLAAAVHLQVESATKICTKFMVDNLNVHDWYKVLKVFRSYKLAEAAQQVLNYVKKDICEIVKIFNNHQLAYDDVEFFTENWQSAEYGLFQFIVEWVNADLANRKQYQDRLLCNVRYCLMLPAELDTIKAMKIFRKSPNPWRRLITKAVKYHKMPIHQRVLEMSEQNRVRSPPCFVTFSKPQAEDSGSFYEALKERRFIKHEALKLPAKIGKYPTVYVANNFLVAGSDLKWAIFDPRTLQWCQIAKLKFDSYKYRFTCEALTHDAKYLYVIGGILYWNYRDIELFFTYVQRYDFKTNTWKTLKELPFDMADCDACIIDNHLYICGGRTLTLLCLNLATKKWLPKARLLKQHEWCTMHVMKVFGEESICIFDEACYMEYYVPSRDEWLRCTFSFSNVPYSPNANSLCRKNNIWGKNYNERSLGNTLFLSDIKPKKATSRDQKACATVQFPEEGTEAVVDFLHEYSQYRMADFCAILSIAPHTTTS